MKRCWMAATILLACCSSVPENAPNTVPEDAVVKDDDAKLAALVDRFRNDGELLAELNRVSARSDEDAEQIVESCDDAILVEAWKDRGRPLITGEAEVRAGMQILEGIHQTGSKYVAPHLEELRATVSELKWNKTVGEVFSWTDGDVAELVGNLKKQGWTGEADYVTAKADLLGALRGADCGGYLGRYCTWSQERERHQSDQSGKLTRTGALLLCDLMGWARELRLNYPQNDYVFDRFRPYMSDDAIVAARVRGFMSDMAQNGPEKAFARIEPPDEQYGRLIAARQIYVDAIEAGGWPKVESVPKNLTAEVGKSYSWAPSLKKRLSAEGYAVGDIESGVFDDQTRASVELYRELHQLNQKKLVDATLIKNMEVSPETRLENIDLTIQRYREAAVGSLPYYVKVNVPDFYGEVWKDGRRIRRFRIVAGNNKVEKDPETNKPVPDENLYPLHPNRTPLQTSKINEIIYLPYWNVPARIRQQELEPKLAENPNYYAENNYEEVNVGDPKLYYVRELPNPKNSLGKVKLMFPNPHNTYLHDTPAKAAFNNPVRALSHGCMRTQDPLELARLLLENDGQWNESKVNAILKADPPVEEHILLRTPVDVDVVYFNNRVDDAGVVAFLSDVYEYDAVRLGRVKLQKLPKPKDWPPKKK